MYECVASVPPPTLQAVSPPEWQASGMLRNWCRYPRPTILSVRAKATFGGSGAPRVWQPAAGRRMAAGDPSL